MGTRFSTVGRKRFARRLYRGIAGTALVGTLLLSASIGAPGVLAQDDGDADGLYDQDEITYYLTDPLKFDTDGDGIGDGEEVYFGTEPLTPDAAAPARVDSDGDGLYDDDESSYYFTDPATADTDGDGASDGDEAYYGTDPLDATVGGAARADGDADGLYDDDERDFYGTDPLTFDTDGDGVGDGEEVYVGTDPKLPAGGGGNGGGNGGNGGNGGAVGANCLDAEEAVVLTMINQLRAANGAAPVQVSGTLNAAAEGHSLDMGVRNFTAHTNPDGKTEQDRIFAAGYVPGNPYKLAENIAWGLESGSGTYAGWEASPVHFGNMVDPELMAIGIARVQVPGSTYGWYWTTTHANVFDAAPVC